MLCIINLCKTLDRVMLILKHCDLVSCRRKLSIREYRVLSNL